LDANVFSGVEHGFFLVVRITVRGISTEDEIGTPLS